ncbi:VWA domain-containing protein [Hoeflea sp.]|uniref:VWA domain-containing protein n=1 Tax=Hoeflea sp. TaxID=1940281 RepID=UPI003747FD7E
MSFSDFFFLRPYWLLMLIPVALVLAAARNLQSGAGGDWQKLVDPHLLRHLAVQGRASTGGRWKAPALAIALIGATIAMAGPTWQKIELPTFKASEPVVMVMSLAQSMNANDVAPSRLQRAGHKVRDLLAMADGGDMGFVIYSDRPFVATPLTSDTRVIREMLPELSTDLMPVLGNRLDLAITQASDLLSQAHARSGRIIVLADDAGNNPDASVAAANAAKQAGYTVSVLGIGTESGAQLQTASGQAILTGDGKTVTTALDETSLTMLASAGGGKFVRLTAGNADVDALMPATDQNSKAVSGDKSDLHADTWSDMGYWFLLIPVLLAPLAFRRGVLMLLPLALTIGMLSSTPRAEAAVWADLWKTPDQQGAQSYQQGDYAAAAQQFDNAAWKASAAYRAGDYETSSSLFGAEATDGNAYNRGNALAWSGRLEDAVAAYDKAIEANPGDADARFNRDLVAKLLEEQKQQQPDQQESDQQQQESGGKQQQDQGSGDPQNQDQKSGGQQQQNSADKAGKGDQNHAGGPSGAENPDQAQQQADKGQKGDQQNAGQSSSGDDQSKGSGAPQQEGQQRGQQPGLEQTDQAEQKAQQGGKPQSADQQQAEAGSGEGSSEKQETADAQPAPDHGSTAQPDQTAQNSQDVSAAETGQNPQQQHSDHANAQASGTGSAASEKSAFQQAMDRLLQGNGEPVEHGEKPSQQADGSGYSELDQAREQQLRAVPDEPAGLLKARIRQYYAQLYAKGQNR